MHTIFVKKKKKKKKIFSYFFALFLLYLDIDACDFKSFDFYLTHFIHNQVLNIQCILVIISLEINHLNTVTSALVTTSNKQ
jgi:hypothetical protein